MKWMPFALTEALRVFANCINLEDTNNMGLAGMFELSVKNYHWYPNLASSQAAVAECQASFQLAAR